MQRILIGLIVLGLAGISNAEDITFVTGGVDRAWTTIGNWTTNQIVGGVTNTFPAGRIPTTGDVVKVNGYRTDTTGLFIDSADARAAELEFGPVGGAMVHNWSYVTINSEAQLTLSGDVFAATAVSSHRKIGYMVNNGTLNALDIGHISNGGWRFNNYGTVNLSGDIDMRKSRAATFNQYSNSVTCGTLLLGARGNSNILPIFNMYGGTVTGTTLATTSDKSATLNLHGGRMTFDDVTFFDGTNGIMDVQFPGMLVIEGQDKTNYLQTAIDDGYITSDGVLDLSYVGGNTFLQVSGTVFQADGTVFQEGVSPTTVYNQGATFFRSDDPASTNDADPHFELIVGPLDNDHLLRALLEFDLSFIQDATEIDSVSLVLNTRADSGGIGGTNTFNVYAYGHDFDETTATWNDPDGDGDDNTGDATDGGTLGTLLASATFNVTNTGLTVTFSNSAPFRAAVTDARADDNILRLIIANADETANDTAGFARFAADSVGTPGTRPKLIVSHNWSTFQEGVAPDASYTHDATYIHAGYPAENYDNYTDNIFFVGVGSSDVIRGLLKFDVSSIPSTHAIDEASLAFTTHTNVGAGGDNTFNLYAYGYDFDETNATWNTPGGEAPTGGSMAGTLLASATFDTTVADLEVTFDDTAPFRAAVANALAGDGFLRMILANADESVVNNYTILWDDEAGGSAAFKSPELEVISHEPPKGTVIIVK